MFDLRSHLPEILSDSVLPIFILDREVRFLFANTVTGRILGRPATELIGLRLRDALTTPSIDEIEARIQHAIDVHAPYTHEDEIHVPGGPRWFAAVLTPIRFRDLDQEAILVVAHDVTDRRVADMTLRKRVELEELIADVSTDFLNVSGDDLEATVQRFLRRLGDFLRVDRVVLWEMDDHGTQMTCVNEWMSKEEDQGSAEVTSLHRTQTPWFFAKLLGGEPIVIRRLSELPVDWEGERALLKAASVQSVICLPLQIGGRTVAVLCLENSEEVADWSEMLIARLQLAGNCVASARERIRAERELAKSQNLLHGITDASPHVCFVFDLDQKSNLFLNRQIVQQLGYSVDEILHMGDRFLQTVVHPDELADVHRTVDTWQAMTDDEVRDIQGRFLRSDGQWRWLRVLVKVFRRAPSGDVQQVIGWAEDVTDRRRAEEEVQRHRLELARVDRMNVLGEMVAGVTHELSQPLYAIRNFVNAAQNLLEAQPGEALNEGRAWLQQASRAASAAGEIIGRLRSFARGHQKQRSQVSAKHLVAESIALLQFEFERQHVRLRVSVPEELTVHADRLQVQQVLVNLLQNACDAVGPRPENERAITIGALPTDHDSVEFSVSDSGIGFTQDATEVFAPFITTKPHGLGLGLTISKTIVEDHGGRLWAEPNPDRGVNFRFDLPVFPPDQLK